MKYLVVFSLIAAVASAGYLKPQAVASEVAEVQEIIAAINSPSTDPATAAALEQLLLETLGISSVQEPAPISVGPAIVEEIPPISVGPAILDFPVPDGGAVTAEEPAAVGPALVPAPVVEVSPAAEASAAPLVQIILNINQAGSTSPAAIVPAPVETPVVAVDPVNVVDEAVNVDTVVPTPVQVVEVAPVQVVDVTPVQVVDVVPVQVVDALPAEVVTPVLPEPVIIVPDMLN